jgi:hypothetical protein
MSRELSSAALQAAALKIPRAKTAEASASDTAGVIRQDFEALGPLIDFNHPAKRWRRSDSGRLSHSAASSRRQYDRRRMNMF